MGAEALIIAGTTAAAAGQVKSSFAQATQAESQRNIARFNASLAERQAKEEQQRSMLAQQRQAQESERQQSAIRAQLGISGALIGEGTPLRIETAAAEEAEFAQLMTGFESMVAQQRSRSQAQILASESRMFGQQAKGIRQGLPLQVGGTVLTGFGTAARFSKSSSTPSRRASPFAGSRGTSTT